MESISALKNKSYTIIYYKMNIKLTALTCQLIPYNQHKTSIVNDTIIYTVSFLRIYKLIKIVFLFDQEIIFFFRNPQFHISPITYLNVTKITLFSYSIKTITIKQLVSVVTKFSEYFSMLNIITFLICNVSSHLGVKSLLR